MSYLVSIVRPITKQEMLSAVAGDDDFEAVSETDDCIVRKWVGGEREEMFVLSQGTVQVTTPSEGAFNKMQELANKLAAEVIGEEEKYILPTGRPTRGGGEIRLGWPIVVIILILLLICRW